MLVRALSGDLWFGRRELLLVYSHIQGKQAISAKMAIASATEPVLLAPIG